jgi:PilZ domain
MTKQAESSSFRRSARVHVYVPVVISGKLPDGKPFSEETLIMSISKYGAKVKTDLPLQVGMQVKIQPKRRRETANFRVVWKGREGTPREGEVGIEYVKVSNFLGVAFPD